MSALRYATGRGRFVGQSLIYPVPIPLDAAQYFGAAVVGEDGQFYYSNGLEWIVPIEDNLLIEAKVRPSDVAFLHPGQPALVKITAYDYSIYGGLDATLENITADSITNDKGESFYLVRVRTKTNRFGTLDKPMPIMPGMTATVHIQTGRKTVLTYLLKPIIKARSEALRER